MENKKLRIAFIVISSLITTALITFIFSNSLKSPTASTGQSLGLYDKIVNFFEINFGQSFAEFIQGFFTEYLLRKTAHVIEYTALGVSLNLTILSIFGVKKNYLFLSLGFGLTIASIDEILQMHSGRGASVLDVLLDFISFLIVTLIFFIVYAVINKKAKSKLIENDKAN